MLEWKEEENNAIKPGLSLEHTPISGKYWYATVFEISIVCY
jgi:hypothetical protein